MPKYTVHQTKRERESKKEREWERQREGSRWGGGTAEERESGLTVWWFWLPRCVPARWWSGRGRCQCQCRAPPRSCCRTFCAAHAHWCQCQGHLVEAGADLTSRMIHIQQVRSKQQTVKMLMRMSSDSIMQCIFLHGSSLTAETV